MSYDGITPSLSKAVAKLFDVKSPNDVSKFTRQACGALGLKFRQGGGKYPTEDSKAIYQWLESNHEWLKANKPVKPIPELDNDLKHPAPIPEVVPITQLVNEPAPLELNIIQSINCDKFVSINYRHADNSRHTVQLEKFYIDALKAIGITDISKFVAENAGLKSVTKNVKRAIVFELVKRATVAKSE